MNHSSTTRTLHKISQAGLATSLVIGGLLGIADVKSAEAATQPFVWSTVANFADTAPGGSSGAVFNSFSQPSINNSGDVVFRARTSGSSSVRGVFLRSGQGANRPLTTVAVVGDQVPQPNNTGASFTEFPSFPRIDATSSNVVTRGQSTPVWTYSLNGTDTKVGTSGLYAVTGGSLTTGVSLLGNVPGQEVFQVPNAPAGTRFDQFPGAPAIDGQTIAFKGNYTNSATGLGQTGVYFRDLSQSNSPVRLIADTATVIPGQTNGGSVTFGSTAPPSAANGEVVFTGWDNEGSPTVGGVYLASLSTTPNLQKVVGIGDHVPGQGVSDTFTNFGEGVSFDGRFIGFWGSWGSATQEITLYCPSDGNADLLAYCEQTYPHGFTTQVPVHQGIFVYDTQASTSPLNVVTTTGLRYSGFQYWVFSGSPPGTGSGDATLEPPRWRVSSFVAVSGLNGGQYQVAFKGTQVDGATGIYVGQGPSVQERILTAVRTSEVSSLVDPSTPGAGSTVSSVGLERDGFRGRYLALTASMLDAATSTGWAGEYVTLVPNNLPQLDQSISFGDVPSAYPGDHYAILATTDSGLPITYGIDAASSPGVCTLDGSTVYYRAAGSCLLDATVSGDAGYLPATSTLAIEVVLRSQSIVFDTVPHAYPGDSYVISSTADSGLPVSYAADPANAAGVCTLDGATVAYGATGTCVIGASVSGNGDYLPAQSNLTIEVVLRPQSISMSDISSAWIGGTFNLDAVASSGLPVSYALDASSGDGVCSLDSGQLHFDAVGTCVLTLNQGGDSTFAPASEVTRSITVSRKSQSISAPASSTVYVGSLYQLSATSSSELPLDFTVDGSTASGTCSISASTVSFLQTGSCVIDVNQSGDTYYDPAPTVRVTFTVIAWSVPPVPPSGGGGGGIPTTTPKTQEIQAAVPPPVTVFDTYVLTATTSSNLPVTYSVDPSSTAGACIVTGATVRFNDVGTCVIDIDQPGDDTYAAAPQMQQQFTIGAVTPSLQVGLNVATLNYGQVARATAVVEVSVGAASGQIQFTVDGRSLGTPQPLINGVATSPALADAAGRPLVPGQHRIGAVFLPSDKLKFNLVSAEVSHVVRKANTTIGLVIHPKYISAKVTSVPRSSTKLTGVVTFKISGKVVGRARVVQGLAVLKLVLKASQYRLLAASYAGNATFNGTSVGHAVIRSV